MNRAAAGFLAAVATAAFAGTAQAQVCAGYPTGDRGMYFGARADFPEDVKSYGVEANYNFSGPLGVYAGLNVLTEEESTLPGDEEESLDQYYAGLAFEVASLGLMIGPRVSACPVVEGRFISQDNVTLMQFPIGFGVGANLGLPLLPSLAGYVQPQLVVTRIDVDQDAVPVLEDETETDFGIKAGAMAGFGLITVGGEVRHVFVDGADPTFGIRVGVRF